jgi:two-component sensor histidine kinase
MTSPQADADGGLPATRPAADPLQWSARAHLIGVLAVFVVPFLVFTAIVLWSFGKSEAARYEQNAEETASRISAVIDRELSNVISALQVLATSRLLAERRFEELHTQALEIREIIRAEVIIKDASGQQLVNTRLAPGAPLPKSMPEPDQAAVQSGKPYVSDLFEGSVAKRPIVSVFVPVLRSGTTEGLVIAGIDTDQLARLLWTQTPPGWVAGLVGHDDRIIARSREHERFLGQPAAAAVRHNATGAHGVWSGDRTLEGVAVLSAYLRSDLSGWRTVVGVPLSLVQAPLQQSLLWLGLLGICAAAVSALLAKLFASMIAAPLGALAEAAVGLGRGEKRPTPHSRIEEISALSDSLQSAADRLRSQHEHQEFVMRELSHRSKNLLAVVQAMARFTTRSSRSLADFEDTFHARIKALADVHDILLAKNWRGASIPELVRAQLLPFGGRDRFAFSGPELLINAAFAQTLSVAIHELATNASKYGALSVPAGSISITWGLTKAEPSHLFLIWQESGGPTVKRPEREGFGTFVLSRLGTSSGAGKTALEYNPDGVRWTFEMAASEALADAAGSAPGAEMTKS